MGVCVVVFVVGNQLEALRSEGAAEVPLPDRCVPMSASVSTHLCPGLQGAYMLYPFLCGQHQMFHSILMATSAFPLISNVQPVTLKMRMSVSEESCLRACFQGMENSVLSWLVHWTPGYLLLLTCSRSHGMSSGLQLDISAEEEEETALMSQL